MQAPILSTASGALPRGLTTTAHRLRSTRISAGASLCPAGEVWHNGASNGGPAVPVKFQDRVDRLIRRRRNFQPPTKLHHFAGQPVQFGAAAAFKIVEQRCLETERRRVRELHALINEI